MYTLLLLKNQKPKICMQHNYLYLLRVIITYKVRITIILVLLLYIYSITKWLVRTFVIKSSLPTTFSSSFITSYYFMKIVYISACKLWTSYTSYNHSAYTLRSNLPTIYAVAWNFLRLNIKTLTRGCHSVQRNQTSREPSQQNPCGSNSERSS